MVLLWDPTKEVAGRDHPRCTNARCCTGPVVVGSSGGSPRTLDLGRRRHTPPIDLIRRPERGDGRTPDMRRHNQGQRWAGYIKPPFAFGPCWTY